jgi:predicted transcriptional regulator
LGGKGPSFASLFAIVASLLFASVSASVVRADNFENQASRIDLDDSAVLPTALGDVFVDLGDHDFISDLISNGLSIGTTRFPVRLKGTDVLTHEKRWMLRKYLEANPGANFEAIRGDLAMAVGTLGYHLWILETGNVIKSWRDGRLRRYALRDHCVSDGPKLTGIEVFLLDSVRRRPEITQRELAKEAGVSQPAISYHITRMAELGVVRVERRGLRRRYSVTSDSALRSR